MLIAAWRPVIRVSHPHILYYTQLWAKALLCMVHICITKKLQHLPQLRPTILHGRFTHLFVVVLHVLRACMQFVMDNEPSTSYIHGACKAQNAEFTLVAAHVAWWSPIITVIHPQI